MPRDTIPAGAMHAAPNRFPSHLLLIPLAALLAIVPLLLHGPSCGHDQGFHILSWLDAAAQLRHGHYPVWAISPAWNAGEPRFLFYPPLSWLLGALLTLVLPANAAPIAYIFLALAAAGLAMYRLAREFATPGAALLASAFYLANPYMLFNAFERSAFAELLAAAWMPLLLLAILRPRPTARAIAIPLALLWLTNAPAAVMGSYMLALLAIYRVAVVCFSPSSSSEAKDPGIFSGTAMQRAPLHLILTYLTGTLLGLALPAFYLIPAAIQRKFVQVDMAIIPNMRFQDNFLFDYTTDPGHNGVNKAISKLAVAVLAATILAVASLYLRRTSNQPSVLSTEAWRSREAQWRDLQISPAPTLPLTLLTLIITLLLFPISTPVWQHLPELAFLQFPWRLLTILSSVLALSIALLIDRIATTPVAPSMRSLWRMSGPPTALITLALPFTLTLLLYAHTAQACENHDSPAAIANLLATHHGVQPTDEYTPTNADNDLLRTGNPGYWLAQQLNDPAPNTVPTPTELNPNIDTDDLPTPISQTLSTPAPHSFTIHIDHPGYLVLNLRDYPNWQVSAGCPTCIAFRQFARIRRDDGLTAIALPAGNFSIHIAWHRTRDQNLGLILTAIALLYLALTTFLPRLQAHPPHS